MPKILTLHYDHDLEDPSSWDGQWKLYSFGRRHKSYINPEEFFPDGKPTIGLRSKLAAGTAFLLSYYEHSGCVWSLRGEGPQCRWDSVDVAGLLVWEHPVKDMGAKTREARAKDAAAFLETYTAWCNGQGYGYSIEEVITLPCGHTELKDVDSCFGFYGAEYMKDEIIAALDGDTEITIKGEARDLFSVSDLAPKTKPEEHVTH